MEKNINRPIIIKNNEGLFQLIDDTQHTLQTKTAQRGLRIFDPYFQDSSQLTFKPDLTYVQLLELIQILLITLLMSFYLKIMIYIII